MGIINYENKFIEHIFLLPIILSIILVQCNFNKPKLHNDTLHVAKLDEKIFPLDQEAMFLNRSTRLDDQDGLQIYSFFSDQNHTLYVYDYDKATLINKITFELEGTNGIGLNYNGLGHIMLSSDSLMLFNWWTDHWQIFNQGGKLLKAYQKPVLENHTYLPYINYWARPERIDQSEIIIPCLLTGDLWWTNKTDFKSLMRFNYTNGRFVFDVGMPPIYNNHIWGQNPDKYVILGDFNERMNSYIYSFSIDDNIYQFDLKDHKIKTIASKRKITGFSDVVPYPDAIPEGTSMKNDYGLFEKMKRYDFTNPYYGGLFYDQYKNYYYLIYLLTQTDDEYVNERGSANSILFVLDDAFQIIGKHQFDGRESSIFNSFVSRQGFNVLNKRKCLDDEEHIYYDVFGIE
ncbi:MAG TPA: DUF4221 family protein [Saprospiraceae bacterium]|nr:DUF4221 family protein [Saprospiraceae bacterium]HPQ21623.1 DUF4221 family protein [Saprospiraceae bacterium]